MKWSFRRIVAPSWPEGQRQINSTLLQLQNSLTGRVRIRAISAAHTATLDDDVIVVDATSGNVTVTLPLALKALGKVYVIIKKDVSANTAIADGNGTETIDGATTQNTGTQYGEMRLVSDGTEWYLI